MQAYYNALERTMQKVREKLSGQIPAGKIQLSLLRSLEELTGTTKTITFQFRDIADKTGLNIALKDNNIAIAFAMGLGICKVRKNAGTNDLLYGNAQFISYPHSQFFDPTRQSGSTTSEKDAIQGFFNSMIRFETDQTTRLDSISASLFMINEQKHTEIDFGIRHILLGSSFPLMGGKDNRISLTMPTSTDISQIRGWNSDLGATQNFGVVELLCIQLVCDGTVSKEQIINLLKN
jgi:hypothetical protein